MEERKVKNIGKNRFWSFFQKKTLVYLFVCFVETRPNVNIIFCNTLYLHVVCKMRNKTANKYPFFANILAFFSFMPKISGIYWEKEVDVLR